ncbi:PilZ domain-containing protein [Thioalkalivibrio denitrificans]|uniref:Cyclic diguanosine monophosphate-binding protein n=1 Tax=Thioalkalivibrio denitrificans TaxID=108003 RepID=A0A1V3NFJ4_9GAMM|nr:PilZ domain-containing protein [Thioalkalivibrio denitrificans]OOG23841.1 PilZ domain-containing protein [Thioalkalivibrio denitrificans]
MTRIQDPEKRRFHRISFEGSAYVSFDGGAETQVDLLDLSLHGALIRTTGMEAQPAPQQRCTLRVPLTQDLAISMETRVARVEGEETGLVVDRLDLDSAQHLKRLVELNLGDETLLNRDLAALFRRE